MPLLPLDQVREALVHPDREVRDAALRFFCQPSPGDACALQAVIQCIEKLGWQEAFSSYLSFPVLEHTEETIDWLIEQLGKHQSHQSSTAALVKMAMIASVIQCDPSLLRHRLSRLRSLPALNECALETISKRVELASLSPGELWRRLEGICREGDGDALPVMVGIADIIQALSRYPDRRTDLVLAILSEDADDFWPRGLGVMLAGGLRIEAAVPQLVAMLNDDDVWVFEECRLALASIGTDEVVRRIYKRYEMASCDYRDLARWVLSKIYSELSVTTRLELAQRSSDRSEKGELLASSLNQFAAESIEPARQFVLQADLDQPGLTVRKSLLDACKLIGHRFPEFDAWLDDSKNGEQYRQQWMARRRNVLACSRAGRTSAVSRMLEELCWSSMR